MKIIIKVFLMIFLVQAFLYTPSFSQTCKWTQLFPKKSSPERCEYGIAYLGNNKILVFGGYGNEVPLYNDTWVYDLTTNEWTQLFCDTSPTPRSSPAMAQISEGKVLLFGGDSYNAIGDTWIFDLSTLNWAEIHLGKAPKGRWGAGIAFLSNNEILLNGGNALNSDSIYQDTWIYNLEKNSWDSLNINSPRGRKFAQICEIDNNKILQYGGSIGDTILNDIDIFDNNFKNWKNCIPKIQNLYRDAASMVNLSKNLAFTFGGWTDENHESNDSWIFDLQDTTWIELNLNIKPERRYFHKMVKIDERKSILFGGATNTKYFNDIWLFEYDPSGIEEPTNISVSQINLIYKANGVIDVQLSNLNIGIIEISLYNINGEFVKQIYSGFNNKPSFNLEINIEDVSSGVYFLHIKTLNANYYKQLMIVK